MAAFPRLPPRARAALAGALGLAVIACLPQWAGGAQDGAGAFAAARQRGTLVVGVPYLAPPPVAGAKVRTPEGLDLPAAERLAKELGVAVQLRQVGAGEAAAALAAGQADVVLADGGQGTPSAAGVAVVPSGYATRPKAVIRSDTAMRRGADARGRTACVAEAARAAGELAESWGAQVRRYRVPSDALVAVREGACDLGLVDDAVWEPLMRFPEWKKFSATLAAEGARRERQWLLPEGDEASRQWLQARMRQWGRDGAWKEMAAKWARDVAFDVYLDQEVPDCHG
ncbi:transporter substrate-binding domain-containing protein [Achromobacter sp. Marseille-Q4962]|uniref:transporter substrate-binding domain-containing protein n=1 Tax=Achromobacter sp. Marseille-Q4962 TaxID=2942202 RepID=UPI0020738EE4|nr:transporter substrate-binding domain-containing protein [Achromobacter sp. Marseille-Q4962]